MAEHYEYRTSLTFIYFGIGFALAAGPTAMAMTVARPYLITGPTALRIAAMLAPLATGIFFGLRARSGARDQLPLGRALLRAFFGSR